jgi:hypothetical protein
MMKVKRKKRKKISFRIELPKKPSRPIGGKKGKKGYDRKRAKREIEREIESE